MDKELIELSHTTIFQYEEFKALFYFVQIPKPFGFGLDEEQALAVVKAAAEIAPVFNQSLAEAAWSCAVLVSS